MAPSTSPNEPTVDLYSTPHKGLRFAMMRTLTLAGATDFTDESAISALDQELQTLFTLTQQHLLHEEKHLHPALRATGCSAVVSAEEEHAEHRAQMKALTALCQRTRSAPGLGRDLYLGLSRFVAESLEHMHLEETTLQRALDRHYSVSELTALNNTIIQAIDADEMVAFLRVILPAMSRPEREALLAGPRAGMPPEVFASFLAASMRELEPTERAVLLSWADLVA